MICLTPELSDRRWKRAQAVSDDVHKSSHVKIETLSGGFVSNDLVRTFGHLHKS